MKFSHVKMTVEHSGVKASVKIDKTPVVLGGNSFAGGGLKASVSQLTKLKGRFESFVVHGDASFMPEPGDALTDWKVGFIQIVRWNKSRAVYGGRFARGGFNPGGEGSVVCEPTKSSIPKVVLDSTKATTPFYVVPDGVRTNMMSVATGDSPFHTVPLIVGNDALRGIDNFLANYIDDSDFFTVLTAIEPSATCHFLAHIHWRVVFAGAVLWRGGEPLPSDRSSINFDPGFVVGEPTDAAVSAVLKSRAGPIANDLFVAVYNNSFISGASADPNTHSASSTEDFSIPNFFWE